MRTKILAALSQAELLELERKVIQRLAEPVLIHHDEDLACLANTVALAQQLFDDVRLLPRRELYDWNILFIEKDGVREARFCGTEDRGFHDAGRVSTAIVEFDPIGLIGKTSSGRIYELKGTPCSLGLPDAWVARRVLECTVFYSDIRFTMTDPAEYFLHSGYGSHGGFCMTPLGAAKEITSNWM